MRKQVERHFLYLPNSSTSNSTLDQKSYSKLFEINSKVHVKFKIEKKMSHHKESQEMKRNYSSGDDDDKMSLGSQSSVGSPPISTPTKRKMSFDFWNKSSDHETAGSSAPKRLRIDVGQQKINITDLTPGRHTTARIEFRVTLISSQKGTPQCEVFTMHAIDASGEISLVAYRNEAKACREFFQLNKTYSLENFNVKAESEQFRSGTGHSCQIVIEQYSTKKELVDEEIPQIPFEFLPLNEVDGCDVKTKIDVLGVLVMDYGLEETKSGIPKMDIVITDKSKANIHATLWKATGKDFFGEVGNIVALRKVSVGRYEGNTSLNANMDTLIWVNPEVDEAAPLLDWCNQEVSEMKN